MSGEADVRDFATNDPVLQKSSDFRFPSSCSLSKGWGRQNRIDEGGTYGKQYITKYKEEIRELFERGNNESSHKMNPAMMREHLEEKYPNTYSLPGETKIKQEINAM
eukprot:12401891-Ditylum_brightwellii.AAC.1